MEDRKIYVPGNGYRVLVKKCELWIGSMRLKSYNKALKHASMVAKALPDCSVLLVKVCKGEVSLIKAYMGGRVQKETVA